MQRNPIRLLVDFLAETLQPERVGCYIQNIERKTFNQGYNTLGKSFLHKLR